MERLVASCDHWPDITVSGSDGLDRICPVGLELTYDFNPTKRRMAIAIRGLATGANPTTDWVSIFHSCTEPAVVGVFVSFIGTARQLTADMGMPESAAFQVCDHLAAMSASLEPFVLDCFDGRTCAPSLEPVQAQTPEPAADTVPIPKDLASMPDPAHSTEPALLVKVNRDVSPAFKRERNACTMEFRLVKQSDTFEGTIAATRKVTGGVRRKTFSFVRVDVDSILRDLRSDGVAIELAMFFGDNETLTVHRMSCVLRTGFAGTTELEMGRNPKAFVIAPTSMTGTPKGEATIALSPVPEGQQFVEVFNNGQYIRVPA